MAGIQGLFAENVKLSRKRLGFTRAHLAKRAGLSPGYIGDIENGKKFPSAEIFERISAALGLRPYQLVYEADDWMVYDKYDYISSLKTELKEKLGALIEEVIRSSL